MRVRARLADVWTARARTTRARTRTASTTATARARGGSEDARLVVDSDSSGRVVGVDATSSRVPEGAYAGVDPLAASLGALAVWASARARSSGRRAAAAERRARAAEARCQVRRRARGDARMVRPRAGADDERHDMREGSERASTRSGVGVAVKRDVAKHLLERLRRARAGSGRRGNFSSARSRRALY